MSAWASETTTVATRSSAQTNFPGHSFSHSDHHNHNQHHRGGHHSHNHNHTHHHHNHNHAALPSNTPSPTEHHPVISQTPSFVQLHQHQYTPHSQHSPSGNQRYTPRQRQALNQVHVGLQLHHPSPVRAHSYPLNYANGYAFSLSGVSAASSSDSRHNLPSPPLSTSAMPDPWGADRADDDDWMVTSATTANGVPSPRVVPLPPTAPVAYPPSKRAVAKRNPLPSPYAIEVWASLMDLSKGRDKVLKCVQYSLRTYLYVLSLIKAVRPLTKWFRANEKRAKIAVSGLSLTRKCLLLLNPLRPAGALLSPEPTSAREFLNHLIDLIGALSDDIFCLSKLGLVSRKKGAAADRWANRIWFLNTVTGLYGQYCRSSRPRDAAEVREDEWRTRKLLCDLIFVSYDIFNLHWFREPVLCASGLMAALIGTGQLYVKEHKALAKKYAAA